MRTRLLVLTSLLCGCLPTTAGTDAGPDGGASAAPCRAPSMQPTVPFQTDGTTVLHWASSEGCIPVTYASALATSVTQLELGLAAWESLTCSSLCFGTPTVSDAADGGVTRRVHLVSGAPVDSSGEKAQAVLTFDPASGRILESTLHIDPTQPQPLSPGDWTAVVGRALGLGTVDPSVDSVLNAERPQSRTAPTTTDEVSFCQLYGSPSFCGD